ncbi:hypothetical protein K490DRAFT_39372 [Saccharata proteae CBS 121410]|uniref:Endonuclease/exonuclease/phosphatase domain-containing protein n=1 Tax=Saccharata proteae CBS 121410 TaxID=1314787 RepID=A0A9P4HZA0_9PEZI|nr:hypothetical protein K490DRAFT_39372 [Saccharata proteae CBS 121410]
MKSPFALPVRVITHNIRYATADPFKGEELWPVRAPRLLAELRFNTAHNPETFVCLQEVLHNQLLDILSGLNEQASKTATHQHWAYVGLGRDDGREAGEYSPIIYRPAVWDVMGIRTVWLSETPDRPSKGWDAASIRIVTIAKFRHRGSRTPVLVLNTHLDDQGSTARFEAAKIIVRLINEYTASEPCLPVLLAGDFNSEPTQEAYGVFSGTSSPVQDTRDQVRPEYRYGHSNTFTGFSDEDGPPKRIDFLFTDRRGENSSKVSCYAVLENRFDDGVYSSDHRAVVGDLVLS